MFILHPSPKRVGHGHKGAYGAGKAVDYAEPGVGKGDPGKKGCVKQGRSETDVVAPFRGCGEEGGRKMFDSAERKGVRNRGTLRRNIGFEELRERIHAARSSDRRRTGQGEFRIEEGANRRETVMAQRLLEPFFSNPAQHCILGGFAACSSRGRHGDQGEAPAGVIFAADSFDIRGHRLAKRQHGCDRLGAVHHTAAAYGDHPIYGSILKFKNSAVHYLRRRFAFDRETAEHD
jgi:hypothetical protein